ncbi:DUF1684 domain-containing protein [Salegentibacter sp. Hel_I_6]|uniref:DUF1684 domain-containing protein n=1 Tax=Salegentibacter sp. Hel_I_6 TaxID=1250278 RepID=UPI00055FA936|nr:DUF1684 domain-containing protein [Salegentibacter sp. Hel_I_6]
MQLKVKNFILILILLFGSLNSFSQEITAMDFQQKMNEKFSDPNRSPLSEKDRNEFRNLNFFEIDSSFIVEAHFLRTPAEAPFKMQTTTDRLPIYVKYAEIYFSLQKKNFKLNVFQNQELISDKEYYNYLFLPFTDLTNGETTYSGGRYLDLRIPEGDSILLDFNKAYNPYCAYNSNFSCPKVPAENDLKIAISAGVKF